MQILKARCEIFSMWFMLSLPWISIFLCICNHGLNYTTGTILRDTATTTGIQGIYVFLGYIFKISYYIVVYN